MKHLITIPLLLMILLLSACSAKEVTNYKYTFIGEGEFWQAEYVYEGTETWGEEDGRTIYINEVSDVFRLTYKGSIEEIQAIEQLEFSYDTSTGSGSSIREFAEPPRDITFTITSGGTGAKITEEENIQVNVKWDDFNESFELTNHN